MIPWYVIQSFPSSRHLGSHRMVRPLRKSIEWGSRYAGYRTHDAVFRSTTATSVFALLSTFWNSLTR